MTPKPSPTKKFSQTSSGLINKNASVAYAVRSYNQLCRQHMQAKPWYINIETASNMKHILYNENNPAVQNHRTALNTGTHKLDAFDLDSLQFNSWLTGSVISAYLYCLYRNQIATNNPLLITTAFDTYFYTCMVTPARNGIPEVFKFAETQFFTLGKNNNYVFGDIFIPIHRPGHWICCILCPRIKKIYLVDSYRNDHRSCIQHIKSWYKQEFSLRQLGAISDIDNWDVITGQLLNNQIHNCPQQRDGTSCGVYVCITALYWITQKKLITTDDFNDNDNKISRLHILETICQLHGINQNNAFIIDNANIIGDNEFHERINLRCEQRRALYSQSHKPEGMSNDEFFSEQQELAFQASIETDEKERLKRYYEFNKQNHNYEVIELND